MSTEQMRYLLANKTKYSKSVNWKSKVQSMTPEQVASVYLRILNCKGFIK